MFLPTRDETEDWLGVVVAVPEPWVSQITEARLALGDEAAANVPAHITIMPPLAVCVDDREAVFEHLRGSRGQGRRDFAPHSAPQKGTAPRSEYLR